MPILCGSLDVIYYSKHTVDVRRMETRRLFFILFFLGRQRFFSQLGSPIRPGIQEGSQEDNILLLFCFMATATRSIRCIYTHPVDRKLAYRNQLQDVR